MLLYAVCIFRFIARFLVVQHLTGNSSRFLVVTKFFVGFALARGLWRVAAVLASLSAEGSSGAASFKYFYFYFVAPSYYHMKFARNYYR